jgi:hypothetical protein
MATVHRVREHLDATAGHVRKSHQEALREAAVALAQQDADRVPPAPQTGLTGVEDGFWQVGEED